MVKNTKETCICWEKRDSEEDEKIAEEPWYKNPVIFWGGIGTAAVVVLGIEISADNNRKR